MTQFSITPDSLIRPRDTAGSALIFRDPQASNNPKVPYAELRRLLAILTWRRPFDSNGEELFARHYLDPIPNMTQDGFRNRHLRIPYPDGSPCNVIWSCHIDTCHHDEGYQRLAICNDDQGIAYVKVRRGEGNCLGADDGTGVWLMLEMIAANRPGRYIFHRGEERGCRGSQWIADNNPDALKDATAAIAFDRRDFSNIITHQGGERGCSEAFASSLATMLPGFKADPTGLYTDTRKYFKAVPECTNLSVGYQSQHGPLERQYLDFAAALRTAVLVLDTTKLTIARDPSTTERATYYHSTGGYHGRTNFSGGHNRYSQSGNDPDNQDPNHYIHRASGGSEEFYVWSRKEGKNILRLVAKFVRGPDGGYVTMTAAEQDAAREARKKANNTRDADDTRRARAAVITRSEAKSRAEDADDDLNADDELFDIQLEIDLERSIEELCFTYPNAAAKLLAAAGIDENDMLQMVYGDYLDDADDDDTIDEGEDAGPATQAPDTSATPAAPADASLTAAPTTESEPSVIYCGLCQGDGNMTQCRFPTQDQLKRCCLRQTMQATQRNEKDNAKLKAEYTADTAAEREALARAFKN